MPSSSGMVKTNDDGACLRLAHAQEKMKFRRSRAGRGAREYRILRTFPIWGIHIQTKSTFICGINGVGGGGGWGETRRNFPKQRLAEVWLARSPITTPLRASCDVSCSLDEIHHHKNSMTVVNSFLSLSVRKLYVRALRRRSTTVSLRKGPYGRVQLSRPSSQQQRSHFRLIYFYSFYLFLSYLLYTFLLYTFLFSRILCTHFLLFLVYFSS